MSSNISKKPSGLRTFPIHPFFFGIYPILALLAFNVSDVDVSSSLRPIVLSVLLALLLLATFYGIFRDWKRAALLSTILLILFYSYGHAYIALKGVNIDRFYLFRHRTLVPIWLGLAGLLVWWGSRTSVRLASATYALNLAGLFLLILPVFQLTSFGVQSRTSQAENSASALSLQTGNTPPDIYYIILDGYGRSDVLKNEYGYDNSDFLDGLREVGFYVADCSQSNYAQTQLSLSSSLNFNYIDALSERFVPGMDDRTGLDALIKHGVIQQSLEASGYKTVAFATGFLLSEWYDADYYLAPELDVGELNEFERLLLQTTFARVIQDFKSLGIEDTGSELFRRRTLFALDKLDKLTYIREPKFVFVH